MRKGCLGRDEKACDGGKYRRRQKWVLKKVWRREGGISETCLRKGIFVERREGRR